MRIFEGAFFIEFKALNQLLIHNRGPLILAFFAVRARIFEKPFSFYFIGKRFVEIRFRLRVEFLRDKIVPRPVQRLRL